MTGAQAFSLADINGIYTGGIGQRDACAPVRQKGNSMNKRAAIVGVGVGAALMYFFDPDRGRRRRALVRDKVESAGNKAQDYAEKMGRDLSNRAYGMFAETKSILRGEGVTDSVLADRVRAKLGRYAGNMGAIDVQANDGTITLSGPISATELPTILRATKFVRGVKAVDNQLSVRTEAPNETSSQAGPQTGTQTEYGGSHIKAQPLGAQTT